MRWRLQNTTAPRRSFPLQGCQYKLHFEALRASRTKYTGMVEIALSVQRRRHYDRQPSKGKQIKRLHDFGSKLQR